MNRMAQLADQLARGELALKDIDVEKELAILGLRVAANDLEFVEKSSKRWHASDNTTIIGIARLLEAHPEFVKPVENFVAALAAEALKNDKAAEDDEGGQETPLR